ncbi:unnamed protein product, partial [Ceratitis capitata]
VRATNCQSCVLKFCLAEIATAGSADYCSSQRHMADGDWRATAVRYSMVLYLWL